MLVVRRRIPAIARGDFVYHEKEGTGTVDAVLRVGAPLFYVIAWSGIGMEPKRPNCRIFQASARELQHATIPAKPIAYITRKRPIMKRSS